MATTEFPVPSANRVAQLILSLADEEELISNLKLQKLLYYAQGFHLAMHGAPLSAAGPRHSDIRFSACATCSRVTTSRISRPKINVTSSSDCAI